MWVVKKCEICSAPATVFLTQIINGKSTKFCLCAKCAQERGPSYPETVGADLTPVEIEPGHWVAPDPCALEPEDWNRIRQR